MNNAPKDVFAEYERGRDYKAGLGKHGIYEQAKINERFYVGDQWHGARCGDSRPLVRHNIIKRIGEYKMSIIGSSPVTVNYSSDGTPNTVGLKEEENKAREAFANGDAYIDATQQPDDTEIGVVSSALSDYFNVTKERVKWDSIVEQALRNSYISGTGVLYTYWDDTVMTGLYADEAQTTPIMGDIACEILDVENVVFGDPNCDDVQRQPYILIAQRKTVDELKRTAKKYRRPKDDIDSIKPDRDISYNSGDRGEIEPEGSKKATVITKMYKEYDDNGGFVVKAVQVCSSCVVRPEWDMKIRVYPISIFCWERRRSSIYGESEITYLVPNQIAINRMLTSSVWSVMLMGMPIMAINKQDFVNEKISNAPGQVLEYTGLPNEIQSAITYFTPPNMTANYQNMISDMISNTLTQSGANDAALGDIRPDNTSAIIAVREAATMPLQPFKQRFYQFCEDTARVFAEFWIMLYGKRSIKIQDERGTWYMPFDGDRYKDLVLSVKVDVGASTLWSEAQSLQTLDNLLGSQLISPVQYLERLPKGIIPNLSALISQKRREMEQQQAMVEQQAAMQTQQATNAQIIGELSPEEQELFSQLSHEEQQAMIETAIGGAQQ